MIKAPEFQRLSCSFSVIMSFQLADVITAVALYMAVKDYNKQVVRKEENVRIKYYLLSQCIQVRIKLSIFNFISQHNYSEILIQIHSFFTYVTQISWINYVISADKAQMYNQEMEVTSYFVFPLLQLQLRHLCPCSNSVDVSDVSVQEAEICPGGRLLPPRLPGAHQAPQRDVLHPSESGHVVSTQCLRVHACVGYKARESL